jgi:hypothetical protein
VIVLCALFYVLVGVAAALHERQQHETVSDHEAEEIFLIAFFWPVVLVVYLIFILPVELLKK